MPTRPKLLSLGDRVRYDGREHAVAALQGTSVRLVDDAQAASVVLLGHLLASEGFAVLGTALSRPPLPEAGVLEGLPEEAVEPTWFTSSETGHHNTRRTRSRSINRPGPVEAVVLAE